MKNIQFAFILLSILASSGCGDPGPCTLTETYQYLDEESEDLLPYRTTNSIKYVRTNGRMILDTLEYIADKWQSNFYKNTSSEGCLIHNTEYKRLSLRIEEFDSIDVTLSNNSSLEFRHRGLDYYISIGQLLYNNNDTIEPFDTFINGMELNNVFRIKGRHQYTRDNYEVLYHKDLGMVQFGSNYNFDTFTIII